ncbi:MAG: DNA translocase FtsK 4TM domain-containing protein [Alphaproteobacteria bacterium]|nr:DNA translocase FtsK 4TM domain-containing protein [Alphaproteobacteria bacterium]
MPPRSLIRSPRPRNRRSTLLPQSLHEAMTRWVTMACGGAVMLVAVMVALSVLSYNPHDPSWNTAGATTVHNWIGSVGSYSADVLWQFFGFGGILIGVVLGAWGWRIAVGRGLDLLPWRLLAAVLAMLAFAIGFAALDIKFLSSGPAFGGALGKILSYGILSILPEVWGRYAVTVAMFIVAVGSLYMACALTLGEWRVAVQAFQQFVVWSVRQVHRSISGLWDLLHKEDSGNLDEEEIVETVLEEEEPEPEEKPAIVTKRARSKTPIVRRPAATARQARLALRPESDYPLPPLDLLQWPESARQAQNEISEEALEKNAKLLESVLADFGVNGQITKVSPGPVVTLYELEPSPGTRAARVISLADDIARNMSAASVRVAVVPGRNVIGIELPNLRRETVYLRELLSTDTYADTRAILPLVLGKDIAGQPITVDMARMPHLLIAGTTGSGKSVAINTMILSLLYRLPPNKCRFIMIDPKMLELSVYEGIPHLLAPVVTEPKKAIMALRWTVREMEERYRAMSKLGVRNIEGYNMRLREAAKNDENLTRTVQTGFDRETGKPIYEEQPLDLTELPYIVVIVDEMADLMIVAGKEIETAVQRLAQMARAAGIHILMATQRPSVDVITGTIKANFPTRISFQVTSKIDSRTILGEQGAEQLLGQGDMLYMAGGGRIMRVHGPFVRDDEVESVVKFLKKQGEPEYLDEVTEDDGQADFSGGAGGGFGSNMNSGDELYDKAVDIVLRERKASTSFIQRHLQLGYNKAATLIERMEREGIISSANAIGKREVYGREPDEG